MKIWLYKTIIHEKTKRKSPKEQTKKKLRREKKTNTLRCTHTEEQIHR